MPTKLLRLRDVLAITGRSRSSIYRDMEAGRFPEPVRLSPNAVAWREDDVQAWIDALPRTSEAEEGAA